MGLYVEITCDVRANGHRDDSGWHGCESNFGDNPQGHTVSDAIKEARRLKWIVAEPTGRVYAVCPYCQTRKDK